MSYYVELIVGFCAGKGKLGRTALQLSNISGDLIHKVCRVRFLRNKAKIRQSGVIPLFKSDLSLAVEVVTT